MHVPCRRGVEYKAQDCWADMYGRRPLRRLFFVRFHFATFPFYCAFFLDIFPKTPYSHSHCSKIHTRITNADHLRRIQKKYPLFKLICTATCSPSRLNQLARNAEQLFFRAIIYKRNFGVVIFFIVFVFPIFVFPPLSWTRGRG